MVDSNPSVLQHYTASTTPPFFQAQLEGAEKPVREPIKMLPTINIDAYFADFNLPEDIFHQPTPPKRDPIGEV